VTIAIRSRFSRYDCTPIIVVSMLIVMPMGGDRLNYLLDSDSAIAAGSLLGSPLDGSEGSDC